MRRDACNKQKASYSIRCGEPRRIADWGRGPRKWRFPSAPTATAKMTQIQNQKGHNPASPTLRTLQAHPSIGKDSKCSPSLNKCHRLQRSPESPLENWQALSGPCFDCKTQRVIHASIERLDRIQQHEDLFLKLVQN